MCGDDDDLNQLDEELFNRFLELARHFGVQPKDQAVSKQMDLSSEASRSGYLEDLLRAGLTRAVNDASHIHHGDRMDMIAGQALVFARLSGLLAGQFPPESDLFHSTISALMQGHKEAGKSGQH
jgi:hypothetical protein